MKAALIIFAIWVLAVPCVVVMFLTLALMAHGANGLAFYLAVSLTAAAMLPATIPVARPRISWSHRSPAAPQPNHFQEETHANYFDSQLDS